MRRVIMMIGLALSIAGCGITEGGDGGSKLTEKQRDSVLARSGLAGTSAIGRTMATSDAETRRAAEMNAQIDSLPH
jgi:hypothetical protein